MNFKEVFEKYKNKTATPEEIKYVEEEIEKNSLIFDYLNDQNDMDIDLDITEDKDELKSIKKSIRKKNSLLLIISVLIMITILVVYNFSKPLLNNLYYDPMKRTYDDYSYDVDICLEALYELHFPGMMNGGSIIENIGPGDYDITIFRNYFLSSQREDFSATLKKGKLSIPLNFWSNVPVNVFHKASIPYYSMSKKDLTKTKEYLETLPNYINAKVYISFSDDLSMEEIASINNEYEEDLQVIWTGIRNADKYSQKFPLIGFAPSGMGFIFDELNSFYENFELYSDLKSSENDINAIGKIYESHFKSLLKFQIDQSKFWDTFEYKSINTEYYESILSYVEENGVKTYGLIVIGSPETILDLSENEYVSQIYLENLNLSNIPK